MKITNIEQEENIFTVTRSPNLLQRFFRMKEKKEKYKRTGEVYTHATYKNVYLNQDGEIIGLSHKITSVLDNWSRKF